MNENIECEMHSFTETQFKTHKFMNSLQKYLKKNRIAPLILTLFFEKKKDWVEKLYELSSRLSNVLLSQCQPTFLVYAWSYEKYIGMYKIVISHYGLWLRVHL